MLVWILCGYVFSAILGVAIISIHERLAAIERLL